MLIVHFKDEKKREQVPKWIKFIFCINSNEIEIKNLRYIDRKSKFKNSPFGKSSIKSKGNISITNCFSKAKKRRRKYARILRQIFYLIEKIISIMEKVQGENLVGDKNSSGWEEVCRKIDVILFSIHGSIVLIMPIVMFGKFYFLNYSFNKDQNLCKCKV